MFALGEDGSNPLYAFIQEEGGGKGKRQKGK